MDLDSLWRPEPGAREECQQTEFSRMELTHLHAGGSMKSVRHRSTLPAAYPREAAAAAFVHELVTRRVRDDALSVLQLQCCWAVNAQAGGAHTLVGTDLRVGCHAGRQAAM